MSKKLVLITTLFLLTALTSACTGTDEKPTKAPILSSPSVETIPPTATAAAAQPIPETPDETRPLAPAQEGNPITARNEYFSGSGLCVTCHRDNIDQAGNDVSLNELWLGSMMAHSAVDPYYLAGVSMNLANFPEYSDAIQAKCSSCHMPMAHTTAAFNGNKSLIFGSEGFLDPDHHLYELARDGNSCSACHQIQDQNLGEFSSFSGGFIIDDETPPGERVLFGRFDLGHMSQRMMAMASGFVSLQSDHLLESEICATCHNLYTQYVLEDGTFSEEWFPEQTPYSEWLHSDYATQSTCQDCHMPAAEGAVVLSTMGHSAPPREPFAQHSFVGGNAYMLEVLKNYGGELGVQAGPEQLDPAIERFKNRMMQMVNYTPLLAVATIH